MKENYGRTEKENKHNTRRINFHMKNFLFFTHSLISLLFFIRFCFFIVNICAEKILIFTPKLIFEPLKREEHISFKKITYTRKKLPFTLLFLCFCFFIIFFLWVIHFLTLKTINWVNVICIKTMWKTRKKLKFIFWRQLIFFY